MGKLQQKEFSRLRFRLIRTEDLKQVVRQVRSHVGSKRFIEVMDCSTQQNSEMSMKDWEEFFIDPDRSQLFLSSIQVGYP